MTKGERDELAKVVRLRARVAKADVDASKARLLADFEEQVATEYDMHDERWAKYVREGQAAVAVANEQIKRAFEESGIPESFAPTAHVVWQPRGDDWIGKRRRDELRNVAAKRLDAQAKTAKVEVDRAAAHLLGELAAAALTSEEARAWLERLPSIAELMPGLRLVEVEDEIGERHELMRRALDW
jgi:hypothetical protein